MVVPLDQPKPSPFRNQAPSTPDGDGPPSTPVEAIAGTHVRTTHAKLVQQNTMGVVSRVNEYSVIKPLGSGSFAEVVLARDGKGSSKGDGALYAIKCFNVSLLKRRRTITRASFTAGTPGRPPRMQVSTALDKVGGAAALAGAAPTPPPEPPRLTRRRPLPRCTRRSPS